jgi:hypothetical protein
LRVGDAAGFGFLGWKRLVGEADHGWVVDGVGGVEIEALLDAALAIGEELPTEVVGCGAEQDGEGEGSGVELAFAVRGEGGDVEARDGVDVTEDEQEIGEDLVAQGEAEGDAEAAAALRHEHSGEQAPERGVEGEGMGSVEARAAGVGEEHEHEEADGDGGAFDREARHVFDGGAEEGEIEEEFLGEWGAEAVGCHGGRDVVEGVDAGGKGGGGKPEGEVEGFAAGPEDKEAEGREQEAIGVAESGEQGAEAGEEEGTEAGADEEVQRGEGEEDGEADLKAELGEVDGFGVVEREKQIADGQKEEEAAGEGGLCGEVVLPEQEKDAEDGEVADDDEEGEVDVAGEGPLQGGDGFGDDELVFEVLIREEEEEFSGEGGSLFELKEEAEEDGVVVEQREVAHLVDEGGVEEDERDEGGGGECWEAAGGWRGLPHGDSFA